MQLSHATAKTRAVFDDPNLLAHAGLAPVMALAERAGLAALTAARVRPTGDAAANPALKTACLAAGMAAGADSIQDMGLLRHGAMETVFAGIRAPSTPGSFLRSFTWGNVRQLDAVHRAFLPELARRTPLLPGAETLTFVDVDSTQERVCGYQKEGAAFGHAKVQGKSLQIKGLNPLISAVSTPLAAPVLGPVRLRGGSTGSARGAAGLAAEAIGTAREAGAAGLIITRFDSAFCNSAVISAVRRNGARFSVTVPANASVRAAIAGIPEGAWTAIRYPQAIWDDQLECWVSDAEVAETQYTAFTSKKKELQVTARLIVRRARARDEKAVHGQDELFPAWRYHSVFTDSPFETIPAGEDHRHHAIAGQVIADLNAGPLAHLPSGRFNANAAWLVIAAIAFNLLRAAGTLAGAPHPPPARSLAPRAGMAEPLGRGLRAARRSGLTSPDPVRTRTPARAHRPPTRPGTTDKPHKGRAAGRPRPNPPAETPRGEISPGKRYRKQPVDPG